MSTPKITCIAIDDEPLALEKMKAFIQKVPYLDLQACLDNGLEALHFIRQHPVDLIFLDIQMDELNGIQLLETLSKKPKVILTTAYDQYALKGYELEVSDYLLKPINFQRFLLAVERVRDQLQALWEKNQPPQGLPTGEPFILVRSEYRLQKVFIKDILFVEGMKDYSRIYTAETKIMTLQNLKKIEEALPRPPFLRVHKSYIVSLYKIQSIGRNDLSIDGHTIPIGGLYKGPFMEYIEGQNLIG